MTDTEKQNFIFMFHWKGEDYELKKEGMDKVLAYVEQLIRVKSLEAKIEVLTYLVEDGAKELKKRLESELEAAAPQKGE